MKRAITVIVCVLTVFSMFAPQLVYAEVYYPPTIYVRPDPSYQAAQGIAALLGALIQGANQRKSQQEYEQWVQQTQGRMNELAKGNTDFLRGSIEQNGIDATFNYLHDFLYSEGFTPSANISNGIAAITTTSIEGDVQYWAEHSINMNTQQCRTVIKLSPPGLQAVSVSPFTLPQPQASENSANTGSSFIVEYVGKYLGVVTSTEKKQEGGFEVLDVAPGGLSEFAGLRKGDILTKVDTYDLKDFDIDRVAAYIDMRRQQHAAIKATVLRDGQSKIIEMQL
jgi:membrane-associated protease RseP (regulator of RpoE activity)